MFAIPKSNKPNQTFKQKEKIIMSSKNTNKLNVPEARAAMNKFKMEAASEVGVNLKQGYNGDLTSREAGSVGGQMVKNGCPKKGRFRRSYGSHVQEDDRELREEPVSSSYGKEGSPPRRTSFLFP